MSTSSSNKHEQIPIITRIDDMQAAMAIVRRGGKTIGFVPTMGALHEGHLSLVDASAAECDYTVASVFVNPTQFGPGEDFEKYPRDIDADVALLKERGVDMVFAPEVDEMYPENSCTFVELDGIALPLEGKFRPGHFRGVATIVLKLFHAVAPDRAYFGQKDYQQTLVVKRMVTDLLVPVEIRVCPIVREPDGLAMSSRNAYLDKEARQHALVVPKCLLNVEAMIAAGERDVATILVAARAMFDKVPNAKIDYIALVDPDTLAPVEQIHGRTLAAIAAHLGSTRLIDNRIIHPPSKPD